MATWNELTPEQREIYTAFEHNLRAVHGQFDKLLAEFVEVDNMFTAQIQAILVDLDDNTIVPNTSGLAGSASLDSDAEMVPLVQDCQTALTTYNTVAKKNLRNKAAGVNAGN